MSILEDFLALFGVKKKCEKCGTAVWRKKVAWSDFSLLGSREQMQQQLRHHYFVCSKCGCVSCWNCAVESGVQKGIPLARCPGCGESVTPSS